MREKPSFYVALTPIIFMMIVLVVGIGVMGWPASVCLLISAAFSCIIAMAKLKYTWDEIQGFIIDKISAVMAPVLIVIFVGFMVATWSYAGTLPMLVYYGMLLVAPAWLYAIAFFLNAVLSYVSGASWGSVASIGVALMGIGSGLHADLPILAAAIVTGAYFGDKLSPLSDTTNLTSAVTKTKLYDLIKYLLWTTIPSTIISLLFFTWLGMIHTSTGSISPESMQMLVQLKELYKFGLLPLLPMLIVLCFTFLRLPTVPALLSSAFVAVLVGWLYQGFPLAEGIKATMSGFCLTMITDSTTLLPSVKELLEQGGLNNQGGFLSFIICAMMFAGILTGTGMMDVTLQSAANKIKSAFGAILASGVLAVIINLLTGSDGLNKIVISELMMKKFEDLNLSPLVLARTLEDFGTMSAPIIPWSAAGLYMATTLGVPTFSYLPYCVFCFCSMIFALIYASTGFRLLRFNEAKA
ncbi:Na+/H+ antiporter NhaC [Escherichia coli]